MDVPLSGSCRALGQRTIGRTTPCQKQNYLMRTHDCVSGIQSLSMRFRPSVRPVKEQGPLDEKTAQLVQLAAAASIRSEGAVHSHTRRAIEVGASEEEIHQALLLLTSTIGLPTVVAALSWADDILEPLE